MAVAVDVFQIRRRKNGETDGVDGWKRSLGTSNECRHAVSPYVGQHHNVVTSNVAVQYVFFAVSVEVAYPEGVSCVGNARV